jgi:hypothetical protein
VVEDVFGGTCNALLEDDLLRDYLTTHNPPMPGGQLSCRRERVHAVKARAGLREGRQL